MTETLAELLERYVAEHIGAFRDFEFIEVNTVGHEERTPLHVACARGALRDVELLLGGGANVCARDDIGHTPLHSAVCARHATIVRLLLAGGANPSAKSIFGETPIQMAKAAALEEIERILDDAQRM